jgi:RNA polymerase sigma-70 factor (ECF subfamily)
MLIRELPISPPDEDDILGALVGRAKQGSADAFGELAERIRSRIRGWAARVIHDEDDADDVAQQVLVKLHVRLAKFEGRSRFTTWLYRMTVNTALNRRRVDRRRAALLRDAAKPDAVAMPVANVDLEGDRITALVHACLTELTDREREVFERADLQGQSTNDIAAALGVQPVSVRAALSRARRRMRLKMLELRPSLLEDYER